MVSIFHPSTWTFNQLIPDPKVNVVNELEHNYQVTNQKPSEAHTIPWETRSEINPRYIATCVVNY